MEVARVGFRTGLDHATQVAHAVVVVVVLVEAVLGVDFDAFKVATHDEVHDASDSIRTVNGRSTTGQDFNALDHLARDLVQVGGVILRRAIAHALAVDQHQGARRAKVTQRNRCRTRSTVGNGRVLGGEGLRQLGDQVFDAGHTLNVDVFARDLGHRAGRRQVGLANTRAGHHDIFDLAGLLGLRRRLSHGRSGHASKREACNHGGRQQALAFVE